MDRSLDEIASDRQRNGGPRGGRYGRRNNRNDYPRDGVRKPTRDDSRNIDSEWVHDKFNDRNDRNDRDDRPSNRYERRNDFERPSPKVLVENIHYDLTEEDLEDLFERIGRVSYLKLIYDRAGRSEGLAYVTYENPRDAQRAIDEFHGANANGQPIRLKSVPEGSRGRGGGGRFESAGSGRPLADRMTRLPRSRSLSPVRHSDVSGPPPDNVDRYVPSGNGNRRSRSPLPRRREGRRDGRRPGARRERGDRAAGTGGRGEKTARDGRPKKTQEELDAEMEDYFGNGTKESGNDGQTAQVQVAEPAQIEGDIEMVE